MTERLARALALVSTGILGWTYGGYLLFLRLLAPLAGRRVAKPLDLPPLITVILSAYNEERVIRAKIENLLGLSYPADRLEILVGSDGSSDATASIVREMSAPNVHVFAFSERRGKALVCNDLVEQAHGEWLFFTDAGTMLERDCLTTMARHFGDPRVAMVDAAMVLANGDGGLARDVGVYWKFESALKIAETQLGCLASTFGSCTAVRRGSFRPLGPTEDVDFTTALEVVSEGDLIVHEPAARVFEITHGDHRSQYEARARMVTKNLPGTIRKLDRGIASRPLVALSILSHKVLRWLTPFFLLTQLLAAGAAARRRRRYAALMTPAICLGAGAAIGWLGELAKRRIPVASSALSFAVANAGFMAGVWNSLRGVEIRQWEPYAHAPVPGTAERELDAVR